MNEVQALFQALAASRSPAEIRSIRNTARAVAKRWRIEPSSVARDLAGILHAVMNANSPEELSVLKRRWVRLLSTAKLVKR